MNNYFSTLMDFNTHAPRLLTAATEQEFDIWLDKLALIDRRSAVLYVKANKDKIQPEFLKRVPLRLGRAWERQNT